MKINHVFRNFGVKTSFVYDNLESHKPEAPSGTSPESKVVDPTGIDNVLGRMDAVDYLENSETTNEKERAVLIKVRELSSIMPNSKFSLSDDIRYNIRHQSENSDYTDDVLVKLGNLSKYLASLNAQQKLSFSGPIEISNNDAFTTEYGSRDISYIGLRPFTKALDIKGTSLDDNWMYRNVLIQEAKRDVILETKRISDKFGINIVWNPLTLNLAVDGDYAMTDEIDTRAARAMRLNLGNLEQALSLFDTSVMKNMKETGKLIYINHLSREHDTDHIPANAINTRIFMGEDETSPISYLKNQILEDFNRKE